MIRQELEVDMDETKQHDVREEQIQLHIPIIDKQLANLFRIINNLYLACQKSPEAENHRFLRAVNEAVDYIQHHFHTEEKLMLLSDYTEYSDHKKEHDDFILAILDYSEKIRNEQHSFLNQFVRFFDEWLRCHISAFDKYYAEYFLTMKHYSKLRLTLAAEPFLAPQSA
jgi:hemerythrin